MATTEADYSAYTNGAAAAHTGSTPPTDELQRARELIKAANREKRKNAKPKAPRTFQPVGETVEVKSGWRVSTKSIDWDSLKPNEVFSLTKDGLCLCVKASARKFTDLRKNKGETAIPVECYRVFF